MLASILSRMEPPQSVLRKPGGLTVAPPIVSPDILWSLVRSIRHKASLHLLFNCFCRMWSIVNSDTGGLVMTTDSLWPATLPIHVSVPPMEINKAMEILVEITEALGMDDPEIVTIKGDFHLHLGELEKAVKMYLLSGLPGSLPGFLHSPTAPFFQQTTLRKLISAFESLRCHTYVAVLCQLTLPLDYDTAFRSVAEKVTFDAADQLYYFLWDPLILEHAAFMMQKFGFLEKRQILMDLLQNPVLNSANPLAVAHSVATERATEFSEILFDQYVLGS
jgi:integrator complex subunit 8